MKKFKASVVSICLVIIILFLPVGCTNRISLSDSKKGFFINLIFSIKGDNGTVIAKVSNNLAILPSKVEVYVYLYSCYIYKKSYTEMVLVQQDYISDLNMGKSISVSASTNGEQKYWQARVRYKVDKKSWKEESTKTYLFDSNGVLIS